MLRGSFCLVNIVWSLYYALNVRTAGRKPIGTPVILIVLICLLHATVLITWNISLSRRSISSGLTVWRTAPTLKCAAVDNAWNIVGDPKCCRAAGFDLVLQRPTTPAATPAEEASATGGERKTTTQQYNQAKQPGTKQTKQKTIQNQKKHRKNKRTPTEKHGKTKKKP